MRFIKEIPNQQIKISLFSWNNKFLLKFEAGMYEQTYKFSELDYSETALLEIISDDFINKVINRFNEMNEDVSRLEEF